MSTTTNTGVPYVVARSSARTPPTVSMPSSATPLPDGNSESRVSVTSGTRADESG